VIRARELRINSQVIWALLLRESRMAFGTSHWGYLWAALQPAVTLTFLIVVFVMIGRSAPFGDSLALFFATSVLCLEYYQKLSVSLMRAFSSNASLFAYPPVQALDTAVARFLLVSSVYIIVWVGFHTALILTGYGLVPRRPEYIVLAFCAIGAMGFAVGLINAVLYRFSSSWQHIEKVWARPLFFLSGTFYVPSNLPPEAVAILKWNPIIHAVELGRMGFWPNYTSEIFNPYYMVGFCLVALFVAFSVEKYTRKIRK
jgi:capsular polysaccharide transport system permease protein